MNMVTRHSFMADGRCVNTFYTIKQNPFIKISCKGYGYGYSILKSLELTTISLILIMLCIFLSLSMFIHV